VIVRTAITNRPRDTARRKSSTGVTIFAGMKDRPTNCLTLHIIGTALEFLNKFSLMSDLPCENLNWLRAVKRSRSPVFGTEKKPGVANPPRSNNLQKIFPGEIHDNPRRLGSRQNSENRAR
jgi:hypothetical protein